MKSITQRTARHTYFCGPFRQRTGYAVIGKAAATSCIIALHVGCRPTAIIRRIPFIIINAVKTGIGWTVSHIGPEILKRVPSFAYGYAPAAVILVSRIVDIFTSQQHMIPRPICGGSSSLPMRSAFVTLPTATAFSMPRTKMFAIYNRMVSTFALTQPKRPTSSLFNIAQDCKAPEHLPFNVHELIGRWFGLRRNVSVFISHVSLLYRLMLARAGRNYRFCRPVSILTQ